MPTATLAQFRERIRSRADMKNDGFLTDDATEVDEWINKSIAELYELLVASFEDWNLTLSSASAAVVSGNSATWAAPTDVLHFKRFERDTGGGLYERVRRGIVAELETYNEVRYVLTGTTFRLFPGALAAGSYRLWYIPTFVPLTGVQTFDGVNGWDDYVVVDCAIKAREKEESDVRDLKDDKKALLMRIKSMARMRDGAEPPRVTDVHAEVAEYPWG